MVTRTPIYAIEPLTGQVHIAHHIANTANHTAAFQAAINALPVAGGEIVLEDMNYTPVVANLVAGARKIRWTGNGTINGASIWGLPGQQVSWRAGLGREIRNKADGKDGDFATYDWRRNANYVGGANGTIDFMLRLETTIGAGVGSSGNRKAEKPIGAIVTSASAHANAVAAMLQARANAQGAVWSLEANTYSNVIPATYAHRSIEANIHASGPDVNNLRWIVDIVSHRDVDSGYSGYAVHSAAYGLHVAPGSADMKVGAIIREQTGAGSTRGQYLETALRIERMAEGDLAQLMQTGAFPGVVKIGSGLKAGNSIVSQIISQGLNADDDLVSYSDIRSRIVANTLGLEEGRIEMHSMVLGTMTLAASFGRYTRILNMPTLADEAAAASAGLQQLALYVTATGEVRAKL